MSNIITQEYLDQKVKEAEYEGEIIAEKRIALHMLKNYCGTRDVIKYMYILTLEDVSKLLDDYIWQSNKAKQMIGIGRLSDKEILETLDLLDETDLDAIRKNIKEEDIRTAIQAMLKRGYKDQEILNSVSGATPYMVEEERFVMFEDEF